jgi:hypothetical protein
MRINGLLLPLALVAALGCSSEGAKTEAGDEGQTGMLALKLSAKDAQGESYRLRNAVFSISGYSYVNGQYTYTNTSVSSETEPELPVVRASLLEGYYDVTFFDSGWYFEHVTAGGAELVEKATLLGPSSQSTYVNRGLTTPVSFSFGVNGELVDFLGGQLEIGVTVEQPPFGSGGTGSGGSTGPAGAGGEEESSAGAGG